MFYINDKLCQFGSSSEDDIVECVPVFVMKEDHEFFTYLRDSNITYVFFF